MKQVILRISAWLGLIGGIALAINTFRTAAFLDSNTLIVAGIAYLIAGLSTWALFDAVADILERLPERPKYESGRATYLPGFDPNEPNPPGWNDPK
jgi:hypothetical protein